MRASTVILEEERRALLSMLLLEDGIEMVQRRLISRRSDSLQAPLSFAQQRLWFLNEMEPGDAAYNDQIFLQISGPLRLALLRESIAEIVRRHEILRTQFVSRNGIPTQLIRPPHAVPLEYFELRNLLYAQRLIEARRLATECVKGPFDLSHDSLIRLRLMQVEDNEHYLIVAMHHIICDGGSKEIFARELLGIYNALCIGAAIPLPELKIQYADYAEWQRQQREDEFRRQLAYWKSTLAGTVHRLELPLDKPRPRMQTHGGAQCSHVLSAGLTQDLHTLAHAEDATLFMTLLAGFNALLHRYTAQDEILIGFPFGGRNMPELESLIGLFANTLVLRTEFHVGLNFRTLLQRVRNAALDAFANSDVPFDQLVRELQPVRDPSRHPLFQVFFSMAEPEPLALSGGGLELRTLSLLDSSASKFDLTLYVQEAGGSIHCSAAYNTSLFEHASIKRMLEHFEALLIEAVSKPGRPIAKLLLRDGETDALVGRFHHCDWTS